MFYVVHIQDDDIIIVSSHTKLSIAHQYYNIISKNRSIAGYKIMDINKRFKNDQHIPKSKYEKYILLEGKPDESLITSNKTRNVAESEKLLKPRKTLGPHNIVEKLEEDEDRIAAYLPAYQGLNLNPNLAKTAEDIVDYIFDLPKWMVDHLIKVYQTVEEHPSPTSRDILAFGIYAALQKLDIEPTKKKYGLDEFLDLLEDDALITLDVLLELVQDKDIQKKLDKIVRIREETGQSKMGMRQAVKELLGDSKVGAG